MPVDPNFLERLLVYRLDRAPAPALDRFGAAAFEDVGRTPIRRGGPGNTLVQATRPRGRGRVGDAGD